MGSSALYPTVAQGAATPVPSGAGGPSATDPSASAAGPPTPATAFPVLCVRVAPRLALTPGVLLPHEAGGHEVPPAGFDFDDSVERKVCVSRERAGGICVRARASPSPPPHPHTHPPSHHSSLHAPSHSLSLSPFPPSTTTQILEAAGVPVPNSTAEGAAAAAGEMGPAPPAPPPPPPLPDPWRPLADRAAAAAPEAGVSAREDAYLAAAVLAVEREAPAQVRKKGRRRREGGGGGVSLQAAFHHSSSTRTPSLLISFFTSV